jgi:outer membrane protein
MKIRTAVPALAVVLFAPVLWAQSSGTPAPVKIGVINVQAAITNTAEGKQASAELQSQFAPRQAELQNLQKQIEDLQTRMRTTANTLSDEEKTRLARQYDQLTRTLQRKNQDYTDDTNEAQQEVVSTIGRKLMDVLDKYSKENGYTAILDMSSQQASVLSWSPQIDITQDIIRLYDQNYPIKAAASSSKPAASAAPKPATSKPQQPSQQKP